MDEHTIELDIKTDLPLKHQLGKMLLGSAAAFVAKAVVEKGYDYFLDRSNNVVNSTATDK